MDLVRDTLSRNLDPVPPFAATVREYSGQHVGLLRIYESSDTPHIAGGAIFVREVATDRKASKSGPDPYAPRAVRNQDLVAKLVQRGIDARGRAERLLLPEGTPWIADSLQLTLTKAASDNRVFDMWYLAEPAVVLRAIPLTTPARMRDWAVSAAGAAAVQDAAARLTRGGTPHGALRAHASGVSATAITDGAIPVLADDELRLDWHAVASADAAGVVGLKISYGVRQPAPPTTRITVAGLRRILIEPLLRAAAWTLEDAEFYGRVAVHLVTGRIGDMFELDHEGRRVGIAGSQPVSGPLGPSGSGTIALRAAGVRP